MAQVPTNFGSNAEDGITYQTYNLIDHGTVSSVRFMAQNAITEGDGTWEFYTGDYENNWRPYTADDTLSSFDMLIDPSSETASARYNSGYGGQTGKLQAVQAGFYYTAIVGNNATADNFMSIIETDFEPVSIDTVYNSPEEPTENDAITITVELDGALTLSPVEHVFIRASVDGWGTSSLTEVTNISNGVGSIFIPGGTIPAGFTVDYYAIVTEESTPVHETVDYFTLFFGNNNGANYSFSISSVTGIEDPAIEYGVTQVDGQIIVRNTSDLQLLELLSVDGKIVNTVVIDGKSSATISTHGLSKGVYVLNLVGHTDLQAVKLVVK